MSLPAGSWPASHEEYRRLTRSASLAERCAVYAAIVALSAVCFAKSCDGQFAFDDNEAILSNKDLLPETPLSSLLHNDFWGTPMASSSHKSYRPLTVMTFRLNYWLADGFHPRGFHVCNIVLHVVASALVFEVLSFMCSGAFTRAPFSAAANADKRTEFAGSAPHGCRVVPHIASLFFTVHPVHTESVAAVVGRADLLCAVLYLTSLLLYHKSIVADASTSWNRRGAAYLSLSMICCFAATFSKEQGITVLGLCSAYDIVIVCNIPVFRWCKCSHSVRQVLNMKPLLARHAVLFVTGALIAGLRWSAMGFALPTFQVADNPHSFVEPAWLRVINYGYLYALNGWLMLCPYWLCFDWSMGCVPTVTELTDPRLFAVVLLCCFAALLLWQCLRDPLDSHTRLIGMAGALVVIPFLPASNIFFRVGFVVAERALYLPSIGHCLLVSLGLCNVLSWASVRGNTSIAEQGSIGSRVACQVSRAPLTCPSLSAKLLLRTTEQADAAGTVATGSHCSLRFCLASACAALLLLLNTVRTVTRSHDWLSEARLFASGAAVCPLNAKVHYNLAKVLADRGHVDESIGRYRLAISLYPDYDAALNNLANMLKDGGALHEAEELLDRAVRLRWVGAQWRRCGRGPLPATDPRTRRQVPSCGSRTSSRFIRRASSSDLKLAGMRRRATGPEFAAAWMNRGIVKASLKKYDEAEISYSMALAYRSNYADCLYNLGNLRLEQTNRDAALHLWREATRLNPQHRAAWSNMLLLLDEMGAAAADFGSAAALALSANPSDGSLHFIAGSAHGKAGRMENSERCLVRAVELQPDNAAYWSNLGVLYHRWERYSLAEDAYRRSLRLQPSEAVQRNLVSVLGLQQQQSDRSPRRGPP